MPVMPACRRWTNALPACERNSVPARRLRPPSMRRTSIVPRQLIDEAGPRQVHCRPPKLAQLRPMKFGKRRDECGTVARDQGRRRAALQQDKLTGQRQRGLLPGPSPAKRVPPAAALAAADSGKLQRRLIAAVRRRDLISGRYADADPQHRRAAMP